MDPPAPRRAPVVALFTGRERGSPDAPVKEGAGSADERWMRSVTGLGLLLLGLVSGHASGDVVPCLGPDGEVRFVDGRHGCEAGEQRLGAAGLEELAPAPVEPGAVLLPTRELARSWEVMDEPARDPRRASDLRQWGVRARRVRHYALQGAPGSSRVCSVEVWAFRNAGHAGAARRMFARAGWRIEREGPLLLLVHGVTLTLGEPAQRGLFPACRTLADRSRARAGRLLEERRRVSPR